MTKDDPENPFLTPGEYDFSPVEKLNEEDAREESALLREAIRYHDRKYYVEGQPAISDRAYDTLFARLEELEREFGLRTSNSPTSRVGGTPVEELSTVEHVTPMLSLDSSEEENEVREWGDRVRDTAGDVVFTVEPKFDGVSVEIVYRNGEFDRAVTRGDGQQGDDISHNIRTIQRVPLMLADAPGVLAVRGEIFMPRSGFFELNETRVQDGNEPFANPRNAAAGTVRQLDPSVAADRPLDIYFYDVLEVSGEVASQQEAISIMEAVGLPVWPDVRVVPDIDSVISYRDELLSDRDALDVETDGIVAKVDSFRARAVLGSTARHPRWAFAYKFPAVQGETLVRRIVVQVGRTGKLTPVALLDPVDVTGVTISRASLHNEGVARDLGVTEGATVMVERAGDVIPEVTNVIEASGSLFSMPTQCPVCGSDVVMDGEYHFCTGGMACVAQLRRSVEHYCSRDAMDIAGIGTEVSRQLVDEDLITSIADLYSLTVDDLLVLDSFAERSAKNLISELEASKRPALDRFIYALGIRHVGRERARQLAASFTLDELIEASVEMVRGVEDIGPEVAESIRSFFSNEANRETIRRLLAAEIEPQPVDQTNELSGLTVVFTGSIGGYTRRELIDRLESRGASVTSAVSGETDYLVVGSNPGSTKLTDADELGVETIDGDEFINRFLSD